MFDVKHRIGLGTLLFCLVMWLWIIPGQTENRHAAEFPQLVILFLAVPGLVMLLRPSLPAKPKVARLPEEKSALLRSLLLLATTGVYAGLVPVVGFYVCSLFALPAFLFILGERRPQRLFLLPPCLMGFLYLALNRGLAYQMPVGWFI